MWINTTFFTAINEITKLCIGVIISSIITLRVFKSRDLTLKVLYEASLYEIFKHSQSVTSMKKCDLAALLVGITLSILCGFYATAMSAVYSPSTLLIAGETKNYA